MREIKVAIAGTGAIARVHCQAIKEGGGGRVVAVWGRNGEKAAEFARLQEIPEHFSDFGRMLKQSPAEAVIICTPNHTHAELALEAARAGKHLIIEKPLCLTLEEAEQIIDVCRRQGVLAGYAEELCFVPKYLRAKELADGGALGRVYRVSQVEKHDGPYSPWFWQVEQAGGGILMDMGCHAIEFARWFLGKPKVRAVTAWMDTVLHGDKTSMEDDVIILLEFEGGQTALLESSWALLGGMDSIVHVFGTKGVLHVDLLKGMGLRLYSAEGYGDWPAANRGWTFPDYAWCWQNGYPQEDAHFFECMRTGSQPLESADDGKTVLEIMLACYASAAGGRRIELPYRPPAGVRYPVEIWLRSRRGKK
jgi:myo-inositol 2-dehydrogenase/D-chiro-inositol 1-dehydrogenase